MPQGASLAMLAQAAVPMVEEVVPTLLLKGPEGPLEAMAALLKSFRSLIKGSESLKNRLCDWLEGQCDQLGKAQDASIKMIWKFAASYAEPLLLHLFYHLSKVEIPQGKTLEGKEPDALSVCCIKLFTMFSRFFRARGKAIADRLAQIQMKQWDPAKDEGLLGHFKLLTGDLLKMTALNDPQLIPVPLFFKQFIFNWLNEFLPHFFLQQYLLSLSPHSSNEGLASELRQQFFDEAYLKDPQLALNVISALYGKEDKLDFFEFFREQLWLQSGTEKIVQTIEGICATSASNAVQGFMRAFALSFQKALQGSSFMEGSHGRLVSIAERLLLAFLKNLCQSTGSKAEEKEGDHPKKWLLFNMFYHTVDNVHQQLQGMEEEMLKIAKTYPKNSYLYDLQMRQLYSQMAAQLHTLFGQEGISRLRLDGLPEQENLKQALWESLKTTLFADQLALFFSEVGAWQLEYKESVKELEHYYQTTHPVWACHVLAQYGSDYIRDFLTTSSQEAAKILLGAVFSWIGDRQDPKTIQTKELLLEQEESILELFSLNLRVIGESEEPVIQQFWDSLTYYIETALAKYLAALSKSIHEIEQKNPNLMVDLAIALLKETTAHFKLVNQVTETLGQEDPDFSLDPKTMLSRFGSGLNDGVPLDSSEALEKDAVRIEGFFYPLAFKLFRLADISLNDLPFSSNFREEAGELLMQEAIPRALLSAVQEAMKPHMRDGLMLDFVQKLYAELNKIEQRKSGELPEEEQPQIDPKQKHLNETCGALVLELVKLIPDTMVQYVFMKEQVKKMSAESIGEAIMPFLSKWTFLQVIDFFIYNGLPNLHPARWEGKQGKETLVPRKAFVRPDGKSELKLVKKFKFSFHPSKEQLRSESLQANQIRKQLRNEFTSTISLQLRLKAMSIAKELWGSVQRALDDFIERHFQQKGLKIKQSADLFCRKLFLELIGSVLTYIFWPLIQLIGLLIKKLYVDARSEDIIENLHSDSLENLVYRSLDTIIEDLLKLRPKDIKDIKD
jgi:hypothetical protein